MANRFDFGAVNTSAQPILSILTGDREWSTLYSQLFEGPPPREMKTTMSNLKEFEFTVSEWAQVLEKLDSTNVEKKIPLSRISTENEFYHLRVFMDAVPLENPTSSVIIKIYLTACQPNYPSLVSTLEGITKLKYDTKKKINEARKNPSLQENYRTQLLDILQVLKN